MPGDGTRAATQPFGVGTELHRHPAVGRARWPCSAWRSGTISASLSETTMTRRGRSGASGDLSFPATFRREPPRRSLTVLFRWRNLRARLSHWRTLIRAGLLLTCDGLTIGVQRRAKRVRCNDGLGRAPGAPTWALRARRPWPCARTDRGPDMVGSRSGYPDAPRHRPSTRKITWRRVVTRVPGPILERCLLGQRTPLYLDARWRGSPRAALASAISETFL